MDANALTQEQTDIHFMELALKLAETAAAEGQTPFGAIIVAGNGRMIGQGHNRVRADRDPAAHGEVVALRDAWKNMGTWQMLAGSTLYSSCEPCLLCSFLITQVRLKRVVFAARGTDVPGYKPLLGMDMLKAASWVNVQPDWTPLEVVGDFMREQALKILAAFPWSQAESRSVIKPPA